MSPKRIKSRKKSNIFSPTIDGLHIIVSTNNIHIEDSYTVVNPVDMRIFLNDIKKYIDINLDIDTPFSHRTIKSMIHEWITHNNCYKLNLWPDRTKSIDINYPQKWYVRLLYFFGSLIII